MERIDLRSVKIALNRDEMEEVKGGCGSFWGWSDWSNGPCINGLYNRARTYSVFWFSVSYQQENGLAC